MPFKWKTIRWLFGQQFEVVSDFYLCETAALGILKKMAKGKFGIKVHKATPMIGEFFSISMPKRSQPGHHHDLKVCSTQMISASQEQTLANTFCSFALEGYRRYWI
jgi:hypothetical protein